MRSLLAWAVLASTSLAVATFEYPDTVPLDKRQAPGTPQYQCHEDCGTLLTLARQSGYCDLPEWSERYDRCLLCANTFNIWQHYGRGVTAAAAQCGDVPTPSPSSALSGATSTAVPPAATTSAPLASSQTPAPGAGSTTTTTRVLTTVPQAPTSTTPVGGVGGTVTGTPTPSTTFVPAAGAAHSVGMVTAAAIMIAALFANI